MHCKTRENWRFSGLFFDFRVILTSGGYLLKITRKDSQGRRRLPSECVNGQVSLLAAEKRPWIKRKISEPVACEWRKVHGGHWSSTAKLRTWTLRIWGFAGPGSQGALKGTNPRGQTEPKQRFSPILADFCRLSPFPRKQSTWEKQIFAENRWFSQETAENRRIRRKLEIGVCPLGSSP